MGILLISDSHGKSERIIEVLEKNMEKIDLVIHLGDHAGDIKFVESMYPNLRFEYVLGNNDWDEGVEEEKIIQYNGVSLLLTHGHLYSGRSGVEKLIKKCKEESVKSVFLGHTHRKRKELIEGILVLNPGSLGRPFDGAPSYCIVDINEGEPESEFYYI